MVKKKIDMKLVVVTWNDAWGCSSWTDFDQGKVRLPAVVHTVGWLIRDDKHGVFVAARFDPENENIGSANFIPRGMIVRINIVKGHQLRKP